MAERTRRSRPSVHGKARARGRGAREAAAPARPLVVAISKGRVLAETAARFEQAGVPRRVLLDESRALVREAPAQGLRFILLKHEDVPTYVEYGAADLGVVGRDILLERAYDLYAPLDLGVGRCRLVVAGRPGGMKASGPLRVATKFVNVARRHFLAKGRQIDLVYVQSSVELAPLTGLADVIVDLVQSGETLRRNGLVELEAIAEISSVIVANRVALKLDRERITSLLDALARGGRRRPTREGG